MNKYIFTILILLISAFTASAQIRNISPASAEMKIRKKNVVVLDVRTTKEYNEGHLPSAIHIDVLDSVSFVQQIATFDKNKKYLVYCRSGRKSVKASEILSKQGFTHIWNMKGGITSWKGKIITK
ncbi:MAG: rhodanese-like domain-containing protein [Lacibacter sp.]